MKEIQIPRKILAHSSDPGTKRIKDSELKNRKLAEKRQSANFSDFSVESNKDSIDITPITDSQAEIMEDIEKHTSFTFEIEKFWDLKKDVVIPSPRFLSGGYEWFAEVYCEGMYGFKDDLSMFLCLANPKSLPLEWKRIVSFSFILLNQSGIEFYRTPEACKLFCAHSPRRGRPRVLPLKNLPQEGFLENNKLIVKVEIKVEEGDVTGKETWDVHGFQVLYSQVTPVCQLFEECPYLAVDFRPKSQFLKTVYMNLLLGLVKILDKPPISLTEDELANARIELMDLRDVGFMLCWFEVKLDEISWEREKAISEQRRKNRNINMEVVESDFPECFIKGVVRSWNEWKVRLGFADEKID